MSTTHYTQARAGDGKTGPTAVQWTPWLSDKPQSDEMVRGMAARKYLREAGFEDGGITHPHTFTVWHYKSTDPLHPNGRPMRCHTVTMIATPDRTNYEEEPNEEEEAFRRLAVWDRVNAEMKRLGTREPGSMGDRLFSCRLAYIAAQSGHGNETPAEVITRAEKLLNEAATV